MSSQQQIDLETASPCGSEDSIKDTLARMEAEDMPKSTFLCIIRNFSAVWWTVAMDTGVLSIILHNFPFPSHWTRICGTIMFVLCFVLVCIFSAMTLLQWTLFTKKLRKDIQDVEEIALQACPAIAWIMITIQLQLTCAESWGHAWTMLAYVLWWIELVWAFSVCVILYVYMIKAPSQATVDRNLPTAIFVPIVANFSVANAAGVIIGSGSKHSDALSDRLAVPMIVVGFMIVGFSICLGSIVYAVYMHRLMTSGWPQWLKVPSMILTIGSCGQSASALLTLSGAAAANENFSRYARGYFLEADAVPILRIVCVMLALFALGFGVFWMSVCYYAIVSGLIQQEIHPSLFWWSSIFPVGTIVTTLANLGSAMDSMAFKVLAVILFVFLFCIYIFNALFTIPMTMSGELLGIPKRSNWMKHDYKHAHPWSGHFKKHAQYTDNEEKV